MRANSQQRKPLPEHQRPQLKIVDINPELRRRRMKRAKMQRLRRRRQRYIRIFFTFLTLVMLLCLTGIFLLARLLSDKREGSMPAMDDFHIIDSVFSPSVSYPKPLLTEDFLTVNEFSRPGDPLPKVSSVFVHYTANPGTSAAQNKSYFENLAVTEETSVSSHFIIGYEGEIIQCLPLDEIGYAVVGRNFDSISIECCYLDESGQFTEATYDSLVRLTAWLLGEYNLSLADVLRHYDECGKNCPKFYVENEGEWRHFLTKLNTYMKENKVEGSKEATGT